MSINTGIGVLYCIEFRSESALTFRQKKKKADNRGMSLHTRLLYAAVGTMALSSALEQCDSKGLK